MSTAKHKLKLSVGYVLGMGHGIDRGMVNCCEAVKSGVEAAGHRLGLECER